MARRFRIPFVANLAIVRDDAEMARLNNEPAIVRHVSGRGGLLHRLIHARIEKTLRVDATHRLPVFEARDNAERAEVQAETEKRLTRLEGTKEPFDLRAIASLANFVAGEKPEQPVGVTVQQLVGRMLVDHYEATPESYAAARDVAAVVSSCPVTALRVMVWKLTGRLARSKALIWRLASNDPTVIHATAIAMHAVVDSLERMRKAMRTDVWDTPAHEAAALALAAPQQLIRECPMGMDGHDGLRPNTLIMFKLRKIHANSGNNDLAFSARQWSQCPAHAIIPRLLADVWTAAVRQRSAERSPRRRSLVHRLVVAPFIAVVEAINRRVPWYRLPWWLLSFGNLILLRMVLRRRNLYDTSLLPSDAPGALPRPSLDVRRWRTADGSYNDLNDPMMGRANTRFARNVPLAYTYPDQALYDPKPLDVSQLLVREKFAWHDHLNVLVSAWVQFQVHDWFLHAPPDRENTIPLDPDNPDGMRVGRTVPDPTRTDNPPVGAPTYLNTVTHWWDGSQLYGSDQATQDRVRSHVDGKLKLVDGHLPRDKAGFEITGVNANWWLGLSLFHQLFTVEHNAICDRLKTEYPQWEDEQLFQTARLVNTALITKIHDLEWTTAVLDNKAVQLGLKMSWWGLLGRRFVTTFGRVLPSLDAATGIPGSATDHHGVPFAMTEEFVAVYRMHSLMMPDSFDIYAAANGGWLYRLRLQEIFGPVAGALVDKYKFPNLFYSFARNRLGKLALGNYPAALQNHVPQTGGPAIDLAAVDILRDRERGVPRYNAFRRLLHLPPVRTFEDLNREWADRLREVYGSVEVDGKKIDLVEKIDLMVGLFAEIPPPGFGFSDTTFRVFLLMNARRMKSDRFYTTDYTEAVYTRVGLDWVEQNDLKSVLLRHYPMLKPAFEGVKNVFHPWKDLSQRQVR
jgi:Animal haem peroxidase